MHIVYLKTNKYHFAQINREIFWQSLQTSFVDNRQRELRHSVRQHIKNVRNEMSFVIFFALVLFANNLLFIITNSRNLLGGSPKNVRASAAVIDNRAIKLYSI